MSLEIRTIDDIGRIAKMLAMSCYFDAKGTEPVAIAKISTQILAGQELGLKPFESVQSLNIIKGKPCIGANMMASAVKSHPKYNYKPIKLEPNIVVISFTEDGEELGISRFTIEDAILAETGKAIVPGMEASMLNRFPRNMLFARAMSNGIRWFCPDVFRGSAVYTPSELGENIVEDEINEEDIIEAEVIQRSETATEARAASEPKEAEAFEEVDFYETASPVQLMTEKTQKIFHALGTCRYQGNRKAWDEARQKAVRLMGGQRDIPVSIESSKHLTESEALSLIEALESRLRLMALEILVTEKGSDYEHKSVIAATEGRYGNLDDLFEMKLIKVVNEFRKNHIPVKI